MLWNQAQKFCGFDDKFVRCRDGAQVQWEVPTVTDRWVTWQPHLETDPNRCDHSYLWYQASSASDFFNLWCMSFTIISRLENSSNRWNSGHKCKVTWSQLSISIFFVQAKLNDLKNARLADVCISTSAAPTFLPAHYFETKDASGNTLSFNLIDGGVAANNPVSG